MKKCVLAEMPILRGIIRNANPSVEALGGYQSDNPSFEALGEYIYIYIYINIYIYILYIYIYIYIYVQVLRRLAVSNRWLTLPGPRRPLVSLSLDLLLFSSLW